MRLTLNFTSKAAKFIGTSNIEEILFVVETITEPCLLIFNPLILFDRMKAEKYLRTTSNALSYEKNEGIRTENLGNTKGTQASRLSGVDVIDVEEGDPYSQIEDEKFYTASELGLEVECSPSLLKGNSNERVLFQGLFVRKFLEGLTQMEGPLRIDVKGMLQKKLYTKQIDPIVINTCRV